jgi:dihydropyrimidine dehydrogenase (NAD+) subunit PreA
MKRSDLSLTFAGVHLRAPVGVAPHAVFAPLGVDPKREAALLLRYAADGAGFVYTPVIRDEREHPPNMEPKGRFLLAKDKMGRHGMFCVADRERIQTRLEPGLELIRLLKLELPSDVPLFVNLTVSSPDPDAWVAHTKRLEAAGADVLELNASCPLGATAYEAAGRVGGDADIAPPLVPYALGDSPGELAAIVKAVTSAVDVPVGLKASAETGYPRLVNAAALYADSGLRFISEINSPMGLAGPDIERGGAGPYHGIDENPFAGVVGPWIRYLCYRNIAALAKWVPALDLAAVGGLTEPQHGVEAMMLGAKIVEVSSGMFFHGYHLVDRFLRYLSGFMSTHGHDSLDELRGVGVKYVKPSAAVAWPERELLPTWNDEACRGCGVCGENLCFAITMRDGRPSYDPGACGGCGLCAAVCPKGAISMQPAGG